MPATDTTIRYILLDNDDEPVDNYQWDDSCDNIVSDTFEGCLELATEIHDLCSSVDFLEMMDGPDSDYSGWHVVREEIRRVPLTVDDKATLQKLRDEY